MVKDIHTSDHPAAQIPGATIASLFAEWLDVREKSNQSCLKGEDQAADQFYNRYVELQTLIVDHMAPVTAKDLAMQIVVETDHMGSDMRDEFEARLLAFAKRPAVKPSKDEREAKFEAALTAFQQAVQEYDPTVLSFWVCKVGDNLDRFDGIWVCRSRATEARRVQARDEIA